MNAFLRYAAVATTLITGLVACASSPADEAEGSVPAVATEDTETSRLPGNIIGASGGIIKVNPGTYPPVPPVSCGSCYPGPPGSNSCSCPLGLGYTSGIVCPWGRYLQCFNNTCGCY